MIGLVMDLLMLFRKLYPDLADSYSWWELPSGGARQKNKGWRIDYISVSDNLSEKIRNG